MCEINKRVIAKIGVKFSLTVLAVAFPILAGILFPYKFSAPMENNTSIGIGGATATIHLCNASFSDVHTSFYNAETTIQHTTPPPMLSTSAQMIVEETLEYQNNDYIQARDSGDIETYVELICSDYGIQPEIIKAQIQVESNWNPDATNGPHIGLMQINQYIHADRMAKLGVTNLFDPFDNVLVGIDLMNDLITTYGDVGAALVAYNQGHYSGAYTYYANKILDLVNN